MGARRRVKTILVLAGSLFLFLLGECGSLCRPAFALLGDSTKDIGVDGSIRTIFFAVDQDGTYPFSAHNNLDVLSQTILRLTASGKPSDSLSYEIHWLETTTLATVPVAGGGLLTFGNANTGNVFRYRALGASWNVLEREKALSNASFDRFNVKASFGWGDVTMGRQAITLGKTYFWNPLDVFFPFGSNQFDRDYKPGIDAIRVDIPLGRFSGINVIGSAGPKIRIAPGQVNGNDPEDASWYGSALLGRIFANKGGWDFSLEGGKVYGGWQAGAAAVGDVGPVQLRGEVARFLAMKSDPLPAPLKGDLVVDNFVAVAGLGHRFENGISLDVEYFYNGAGDPHNLDAALVRTQYGSSLQLSRNLAGVSVQYDFTPIITGRLAVINSLTDGSTELQPSVNFSLSNEMDLLIGLMLNFGPSPKSAAGGVQSEFGTIPDILYVEWKYYF